MRITTGGGAAALLSMVGSCVRGHSEKAGDVWLRQEAATGLMGCPCRGVRP